MCASHCKGRFGKACGKVSTLSLSRDRHCVNDLLVLKGGGLLRSVEFARVCTLGAREEEGTLGGPDSCPERALPLRELCQEEAEVVEGVSCHEIDEHLLRTHVVQELLEISRLVAAQIT